MESADEDINLMLRFQNGDEGCFVELVERHQQRVFNIAYRYAGNTHDAEDIAQQVFVNIYNAKKTYNPQAQFTTWLYTVCKNACLKTFRRKKLNTFSADAPKDLEEDTVSLQIPDPQAHTPLQELLSVEQEAALKKAIEELPENQRMVLILCKHEGLSYERIAEITGFTAKAVKSLLHRAREGLKERLANLFK